MQGVQIRTGRDGSMGGVGAVPRWIGSLFRVPELPLLTVPEPKRKQRRSQSQASESSVSRMSEERTVERAEPTARSVARPRKLWD